MILVLPVWYSVPTWVVDIFIPIYLLHLLCAKWQHDGAILPESFLLTYPPPKQDVTLLWPINTKLRSRKTTTFPFQPQRPWTYLLSLHICWPIFTTPREMINSKIDFSSRLKWTRVRSVNSQWSTNAHESEPTQTFYQ